MTTCPNCRCQIADNALFCTVCGAAIGVSPQFHSQEIPSQEPEQAAGFNPPPAQAPTIAYVDPYDHTKDFDSRDISENKVAAMLVYLLGPAGIIIALLSSGSSLYANFHIKQSMKLTVAEILGIVILSIAAYIMWNIHLRALMFLMVTVFVIGLMVIHLLSFFQVCKGKAKEIYLVRNLQFLK